MQEKNLALQDAFWCLHYAISCILQTCCNLLPCVNAPLVEVDKLDVVFNYFHFEKNNKQEPGYDLNFN